MTITLPSISYATTIPDSARAGGRSSEPSPWMAFMKDMPAPAPGKGKNAPVQFSWFFVPADVPETITDPAEREKAAKANTSKLINRYTSIARRLRKAHPDTHDFTFRKVRDPNAADGTGDWGVQVFRIAVKGAAAT